MTGENKTWCPSRIYSSIVPFLNYINDDDWTWFWTSRSLRTYVLINRPFGPKPNKGIPVTLLDFQMAPRVMLVISSGSKRKEPRFPYLSEAKASYSWTMCAVVFSFTPHLLHNGLSSSPSRRRCLLGVLYPVRRPVTVLDWVLLRTGISLGTRTGSRYYFSRLS
jgi:hypothetical protein